MPRLNLVKHSELCEHPITTDKVVEGKVEGATIHIIQCIKCDASVDGYATVMVNGKARRIAGGY